MFTPSGGGLATLAYFEAFKRVFGDRIVLMHAKEYYKGKEPNVVLHPTSSLLKKMYYFLCGHVHRFYPYLNTYLLRNREKYSLCIINGGVYAGDSIEKIKKTGIPVWVIHHNFEREYHKDNKTKASYWGISTYWVNKWERKSYINADVNLFLTDSDKIIFEKVYGNNSGNNYVLGCFLPSVKLIGNVDKPWGDVQQKKRLVISGAMDFVQTSKGILMFYNDILKDTLDEEFAKYQLIITGRNPSNDIMDLQKNANVEIIPNPEDIDDIISKGHIYVCPIHLGGGLKLRLMDGLKQGLPIIVHHNSIRGYEKFIGKNYFKIYQNKTDFLIALTEIEHEYEHGNINPIQIRQDFLDVFSLDAGVKVVKSICEKEIIE